MIELRGGIFRIYCKDGIYASKHVKSINCDISRYLMFRITAIIHVVMFCPSNLEFSAPFVTHKLIVFFFNPSHVFHKPNKCRKRFRFAKTLPSIFNSYIRKNRKCSQ